PYSGGARSGAVIEAAGSPSRPGRSTAGSGAGASNRDNAGRKWGAAAPNEGGVVAPPADGDVRPRKRLGCELFAGAESRNEPRRVMRGQRRGALSRRDLAPLGHGGRRPSLARRVLGHGGRARLPRGRPARGGAVVLERGGEGGARPRDRGSRETFGVFGAA